MCLFDITEQLYCILVWCSPLMLRLWLEFDTMLNLQREREGGERREREKGEEQAGWRRVSK